MTNKLVVEVLPQVGLAWTDITTDVMDIQITGLGMQASPGATSPRGEQAPALGKCTLLLKNTSQVYNPSATGTLWSRWPIRVRGSGPSLGYCAQMYLTGAPDGATLTQRVTTAIAVGDVFLLTWDARAQYDYQFNTDNVYTNTSAESPAWNFKTYTNKWATYSVMFTAASIATYIDAIFQPNTNALTNLGMAEYRNIKLQKGATVTVAASGSSVPVGTAASLDRRNAQSFTPTNTGQVTQITMTLLANVGTPTGNMVWEIRTDAGGVLGPGTLLASGTFTPTPSVVNTIPVTNGPTLTNGTKYWVVFYTQNIQPNIDNYFQWQTSSVSTYAGGNRSRSTDGGATWTDFATSDCDCSITVIGASNLLTNGDFATGSLSPWSASNVATVTNWTLDDVNLSVLGKTTRLQTSGGSTANITVAPDTWILFYGLIDTIEPSLHKTAGEMTCKVTAFDMTVLYQDTNLNLPPQVNVTGDQIITTLFNQAPASTLPGKQLDTGKQAFPFVFDGYTYDSTKLWDAGRDTAMSEGGRFYIDRDGTTRFLNREALINAQAKAVKLTLTDGQPWLGHASLQSKMAINQAILTVRPRQIGTSIVQLATLTAAVPIPPTGASTGTDVTLTFVDATGKVIGGSNVYPPSYSINSKADGSGTDYTATTSVISITKTQVSASQVIYTFTNLGAQTLYLTALTVSGNTVTTYNPIQRQANDGTGGKALFSKLLPYSADPDFAQSLAAYYVGRYQTPFLETDTVAVQNKSQIGGTDLLSLELFDVVSVSDVQASITSRLHAVVAIDYAITPSAPDYLSSATFMLERLDSNAYWILDDPNFSKLGSTTRIFI